MKKNQNLKELNNDFFFNDVYLKSRYKLIDLNRRNEKNGFEIGSHWEKNIKYPIIDDDIKYNQKIQHYDTIYNINKTNSEFFSEINQLKKTLSSMEHKNYKTKTIMNLNQTKNNIDKIPLNKIIANLNIKNKNINPYKTINNNDNIILKKKILKPFIVNSHEVKPKRKRIIYDIRPYDTRNERGFCKFYLENNEIDLNNNNQFQSLSERNYKENNGKIKMKGKRQSIRLNDLLDLQLKNNYSYRSRNKSNNIYSKTITIIEPPKTYRKKIKIKRKISDWKFFDEVKIKKGAFPKNYYYMNYNYDNQAEGIKENNYKLNNIKNQISFKFNQMKNIINNNIDFTSKTLDQ